MGDELGRVDLATVLQVADQLDSLADTAELMGDIDGAARFRQSASRQRLVAMRLLDD